MDEFIRRFGYHPPIEVGATERIEAVRGICEQAAREISELMPANREHALAMTKLEEAMFWAVAGVVRPHPPQAPLPGSVVRV